MYFMPNNRAKFGEEWVIPGKPYFKISRIYMGL